jgi:DNA mismatch repair protein MutS2
MIRPDTLQTLEYPRVLTLIAAQSHCPATAAAITAMAPLTDHAEISRRFATIEEIRQLRRLGIPLPLAAFDDIRPLLQRVRPAGAILNPDELFPFQPFLRVAGGIGRQFRSRQDIPRLKTEAAAVTGLPELLETLEATFDSAGTMLDSASRELSELRSRKRSLTARIRKRLEEIVREREVAIFLQDDFITQRSGRWVIPVRMDSKGMVPGVVHDVSNTGETAFMEPIEIIGLANELENLAAEEKAEMIRILRRISDWLREEAGNLAEQFDQLVLVDRFNSIACFADRLQAETPLISDRQQLQIREGRHPLLILLHQEQGKGAVVPLNLAMTDNDRVVVITGPNTGGKTVALKTAGLLQLMALSGIPVPAAGTSSFPLARQILVDIGDDQSIEASLSTFSAHIAKITTILAAADEQSLILLDELGTGTEPGQGAALACAILDELLASGALVLATTHLADIIGFVHRTAGMTNAAMEFDQQTLSPRYCLQMGTPGQSHALDIARRYGLPERILTKATAMSSRLEADFHTLLAELRAERDHQAALTAELQQQQRHMAAEQTELRQRLQDQERRGKEALAAAWEEAKTIAQAARREINGIIEAARQDKGKISRHQLTAAADRIEQELSGHRPVTPLDLTAVQPGDSVFVRSIGYDATVLTIDRKNERLRVRAGTLELTVVAADLAPAQGKAARPRGRKAADPAAAEPPRTLSIIGQRVDEALPLVERFLDQAAREGYPEIRIVHGKGTGALRAAVRDLLAQHPLVRQFHDADPREGGTGQSIVLMH